VSDSEEAERSPELVESEAPPLGPDLAIVHAQVYRGPNYYSYEPSIKLLVDLDSLEYWPSNTIKGFTDELLAVLPGVGEHSCSRGHAGGLVFDFGKPEVRDFLIQNARFFLDEYRVDGFRYDQVSVIDHDGAPHGWSFCQDLTATLRSHRPQSLGKAESFNHRGRLACSPWFGGRALGEELDLRDRRSHLCR